METAAEPLLTPLEPGLPFSLEACSVHPKIMYFLPQALCCLVTAPPALSSLAGTWGQTLALFSAF